MWNARKFVVCRSGLSRTLPCPGASGLRSLRDRFAEQGDEDDDDDFEPSEENWEDNDESDDLDSEPDADDEDWSWDDESDDADSDEAELPHELWNEALHKNYDT